MSSSTFKNWFDAGAGATLGNLAVMTGYNIGTQTTELILTAAEKKHQAQFYDPVVRADLNDIIVRGVLEKKEYPFPQKQNKKVKPQGNFFQRHKTLSILLGIFVLFTVTMQITVTPSTAEVPPVLLLFPIAILIVIFSAIGKKIVKGGKKAIEFTYKGGMDAKGEEYWYVREYIRQSLDKKEMTSKDAVLKISNTKLGLLFPDTVEVIEANAFYYRQRLYSQQ